MRWCLPLVAAVSAFAQLPDFYKNVDYVVWAVKDLDKVEAGWSKTGVGDIGETIATPQWRTGTLRLANVTVAWLQPVGDDAVAKFLAQHGDGVMSLAHRVPSLEALDAEIQRLEGLGVRVLQRGSFEGPDGTGRTYAFMDTAEGGKYVLGLVYDPAPPEGDPNARTVTQYAIVTPDTHGASAYWQKLGWPAMDFTHGKLTDLEYRGKPGRFDQELGWQRQGKVVYEWIKPLKGPTVYEDFLEGHGEGFHHLAFNVPDMDQDIAAWKQAGFSVSQSGGWGDKGKPGSGRFAYIDTDALGGVTVELLWSFK